MGPPVVPGGVCVCVSCLQGDSLEEVVSALEADGSEWSKACLSRMSALSPTSLRLVWAQLQEGAGLTLEDAMKMEYRVAARRMHDKGEQHRQAGRQASPTWMRP